MQKFMSKLKKFFKLDSLLKDAEVFTNGIL